MAGKRSIRCSTPISFVASESGSNRNDSLKSRPAAGNGGTLPRSGKLGAVEMEAVEAQGKGEP